KHSKQVSDDQGDYVVIEAFPDEREPWLQHMEGELRDLIGDDRAAIVARMIAFDDSPNDIGLYRREVFITDPQKEGGEMQIEERTFNHGGRHVTSEYQAVNAEGKLRWGHLFELEETE